MNAYENWKENATAEEKEICKKAVSLAEFMATCYNLDTTVRNPEANWLTTPLNEMNIGIADQSADQLDCLHRELADMVGFVQELMGHIATLSDVRRELAETTAEDFED